MRITDGASLFDELERSGLTDKSIREFSLDDLQSLVDILSAYVEGDVPPYWKDDHLVFPISCPKRFRYWEIVGLSEKKKYDLYMELGVPPEKMHTYMSQRSIDIALGKCDNMGRVIKKQESDLKE